jgi:hypothetical protein
LVVWEKALGPEHPDVGQCLYNLAELHRAQHRYAQAEPLYQRSLAILEKGLGANHPQVGSVLNGFALLLHPTKREDRHAPECSRPSHPGRRLFKQVACPDSRHARCLFKRATRGKMNRWQHQQEKPAVPAFF